MQENYQIIQSCILSLLLMEPRAYGKFYISTTHLKYLVQRCAVITDKMTSSISTAQTATPDHMAATLTEESAGTQWEMCYIASAATILYTATILCTVTILYYNNYYMAIKIMHLIRIIHGTHHPIGIH